VKLTKNLTKHLLFKKHFPTWFFFENFDISAQKNFPKFKREKFPWGKTILLWNFEVLTFNYQNPLKILFSIFWEEYFFFKSSFSFFAEKTYLLIFWNLNRNFFTQSSSRQFTFSCFSQCILLNFQAQIYLKRIHKVIFQFFSSN